MEVQTLVKHCAIPQLPSPVTTALSPLLLTGYERVMVIPEHSYRQHYKETKRGAIERGWSTGKGYISCKDHQYSFAVVGMAY
ncbi:hypothetical protein QQF64_008645 [Cirrhinus molitorella]|uniref:Uncharacterized protein n=1 Tax=Cirrhinus molitorella TaxID=172907 RepID=A0ABR3M6R8_9TELE